MGGGGVPVPVKEFLLIEMLYEGSRVLLKLSHLHTVGREEGQF